MSFSPQSSERLLSREDAEIFQSRARLLQQCIMDGLFAQNAARNQSVLAAASTNPGHEKADASDSGSEVSNWSHSEDVASGSDSELQREESGCDGDIDESSIPMDEENEVRRIKIEDADEEDRKSYHSMCEYL
ncbi:hypothetical protein K438DRAFT_1969006 [Mycena galopus ATCC 62051]|nr:hypothetical protein K438DRAFT_1969006 [Mycena galopus ATCC 62051]